MKNKRMRSEDMQDMQPLPADAAKIKAITFVGDEYAGTTKDPKKEEAMEFAYLDKHERGGLFIKGVATKGDGPKAKTKEFGPLRLVVMDGRKVKGVATTSRLLRSPVAGLTPVAGESPFIYAAHGYSKPDDETLTTRMDFERGSVNVVPDYMNNKQTTEVVSELFSLEASSLFHDRLKEGLRLSFFMFIFVFKLKVKHIMWHYLTSSNF